MSHRVAERLDTTLEQLIQTCREQARSYAEWLLFRGLVSARSAYPAEDMQTEEHTREVLDE